MFVRKTIFLAVLIASINLSPAHALSISDIVGEAKSALSKDDNSTKSTTVASSGESQIAIGFSPEGSAQKAIVNFINSANSEIRLAAYSFTSPVIVKALTQAKKRGVDVKIVIDEKGNKSKSSIAAMNIIVNAGIPLRTISKYAIHHDKYIVIDKVSVETGSYNYSASANSRNSENAVVLYNMPQVAEQYLTHWNSRWNDGTDWTSSY